MSRLYYAMLFCCVATACTKQSDSPSAANQNSGNKGSVLGKIVDYANNPVKDAKVTIEHTVWHATYLFATSNDQGAYTADIPEQPAGDWTAKAQLTKSAYGQTYKFDLDPDKTDVFSKGSGATRNFTWKLTGTRPVAGTYYGAHVDLYQFGTDADMTKIKLVFTPYPGEDRRIDGSPATAFERNVEDVAGTFMVKDIPLGKYTVKAVYAGKQLLLNNRHEDDQDAVSKTVVFGKFGYLGETEYNIEFFVTE